MSPKTRAGAKLDAQLAAPAPGSRAARKQARDERLGITAQPDPPPQLPTTKKRPRKTAVAPKEVEEAPPQTPERSVQKAKVQTPQSIESTRPSTPPIEVQRFLTTAWTEGNQRYFDSSWGTKFLRSQAPIEPWINEEVWAEHVPLGSIAQRLPERIRTVEIDVGSGRWMNRIYCDIPLFHVVEKTVPASTNALPAASPHKPPPRPHPELYDSPFKRPFVPRPSTAAATQHPAVRPRPPPAKAKDASATVSPVYTLPKNTRMEPLDSEQYYDTPEEAVEVAKTAALRQGFQLSIHRSKGTERKKYELGCYKGGRLPEERKKKAQALPQEALDALEEAGTKVKRGAQSSRMIGCPYKLVVQARLPNHQYQIFTVHGEHNHPPERDIGLVKGNALKDKERGLVEKWRKQNPHSKPLNFLKTLNEIRKENDEPLLPKQKLITNHLSREKARQRANKEPLAVSLLQLQTRAKGANVVLRDHCRDSDKRLDALFITHNRMLPLLHKLDYVIGIDATYEMCQHDLKLLQIVLLLPWGNPLPAAFALMEHEDDETYMWVFAQFKYLLKRPMIPAVVAMDNCRAARNALEAVWPTSKLILCHWHATQNIMKEASTLIAESSLKAFKRDWQSMLHAEFEGEADELWIEFAAKYGEGDEGDAAVSYVSRCWRSPEQWDHIANCITKRIKHYSIRTTSIVEAAHSSLKASMPKTAQRRKLNIEEMLDFVIDWQLRVLRSAGHELTNQRKTLIWQRQDALYRNILTLISQEALELIKGEAQEAQQALAKDRDHTVSYAAHRLCTADLAKPHDLPELDWTDYPSDSCITRSALGLPCKHRLALCFDLHGQDYELTEKDIDAFHFLPESLESLGEQEVAHHPPPYVQAGIDFQHALQDASNGALDSLPHDHPSRIIRCARTYAKNIRQKQEDESDADDESDASDAPSLSAGPSQAFFNNPITPEKYLRKRSKAESKKLLKRKKTSAEKSMKQLATKAWLQGRLCGKCKSPGHQRHQCKKSKEDQMKGYALWEQAMADKKENEKSQRKETKKAARERQQAEREARKAARKAQRREEGLSSDTHTSDEEPTPPPAEVDDPAARLAKEAEDLQAAPRPPRLMIRGVTTPPPGEDPNFYYAADDPGPPTEADFTFDSAPSGREKTPTSSAKDNAQVAAQVAACNTGSREPAVGRSIRAVL